MQKNNQIFGLDYDARLPLAAPARIAECCIADAEAKPLAGNDSSFEISNPDRSRPSRAIKKPEQPQWPEIYQALKKPGMTKRLAWRCYAEDHRGRSYSYSQFCARYLAWLGGQKRMLRNMHRAGEKLFVTCYGRSLPMVCAIDGQVRLASLFVAAMGASHYVYSEAIWSAPQPDWSGSYLRAFRFFGGTPRSVVLNNPLQGRYPRLDGLLAERYGVKSEEDGGEFWSLRIAERWLAAKLRHQTFFSLAELNSCIRSLTTELNYKPFRFWPGSRRQWFEQLDLPALSALPASADNS